MGPAERKALVVGDPVASCPVCEDERQRSSFGEVQDPKKPGHPEVECSEGHRFSLLAWSFRGGLREHPEFTLQRRVE